MTCTENLPNPYNITRTFIVIVVNVNEAPRGINITPNTIAENLDPRSIVGKVSAIDPDNEVWILLFYSLSCVVPLVDFIHKCYGISSNIFPILFDYFISFFQSVVILCHAVICFSLLYEIWLNYETMFPKNIICLASRLYS